MKNTLSGFVEGTTSITTGDRIKKGDHRRDKRKCKHYIDNYCSLLSRKCTGSSHCKYYNDGIKVVIIDESVPSLYVNEKRLHDFIYSLRNKINHKSLEGKLIINTIRKKYKLSSQNIDMAEQQVRLFAKEKILIEKEATAYNESLKNKCMIMGMFIITIPFCYVYYKNNARNIEKEVRNLKERTLDYDLQEKVYKYKREVEQYMIASERAQTDYVQSSNDAFFSQAKYSYSNGERDKFCFYIMNSIKENNHDAILFLANLFHTGVFLEKDNIAATILLSYSSFLGNKTSSKVIADQMLSIAPESRLGRKFYEKSKS